MFRSSVRTVLSGKMFITCFQLVETINCCALTGGCDGSMAEPRALHGNTATSIPMEVWGRAAFQLFAGFKRQENTRVSQSELSSHRIRLFGVNSR